jgi:hypothetical protein
MLLSVLMPLIMNTILLVDFKEKSNIDYWNIVDDGVMGGLSSSQFSIDGNGNAVFSGFVTTENNGGFCSVQYNLKTMALSQKTVFIIRLKGDGKKYQFRVKSKSNDYYSYIYEFQTTTDWQNIEIPISDMYASFRGRTLNIPNYDGTSLAQLAFLISNKRDENFKLLIDKIEVK